MKAISCNFCGQTNTKLISHGPDLLLDIPGDFRLVECQSCGLIYQNPQLSFDELAPHYPDEYLPYRVENDTHETSRLEQFSQNHAIHRQCQRVIQKRPSPGAVLDIGCATGIFLKAMAGHGWQVTGVEPNPFAAGYARQQLGLDVHTGTLDEVQFKAQQFDVITLWDVLEHVHDPRETLQQVHCYLKPDGLVVISLPNPNCFERFIFGDEWVGWERPRHLFLFPPNLVGRYLRVCGFELEGIESFNGRLGLTLLSFEFWLKSKKWPESQWRPWLNRLYNWPLRILTWPFYKLGEKLNRTTVMTVFARPGSHPN